MMYLRSILVILFLGCQVLQAQTSNWKDAFHLKAYGSLPDVSMGLELEIDVAKQHFELFYYASMGFYINTRTTHNNLFPVVPSFNFNRDRFPFASFGLRYYLPKKVWLHPNIRPYLSIGKIPTGIPYSDFYFGAGLMFHLHKRLVVMATQEISVTIIRDNVIIIGRDRGLSTWPNGRMGLRYYFFR